MAKLEKKTKSGGVVQTASPSVALSSAAKTEKRNLTPNKRMQELRHREDLQAAETAQRLAVTYKQAGDILYGQRDLTPESLQQARSMLGRLGEQMSAARTIQSRMGTGSAGALSGILDQIGSGYDRLSRDLETREAEMIRPLGRARDVFTDPQTGLTMRNVGLTDWRREAAPPRQPGSSGLEAGGYLQRDPLTGLLREQGPIRTRQQEEPAAGAEATRREADRLEGLKTTIPMYARTYDEAVDYLGQQGVTVEPGETWAEAIDRQAGALRQQADEQEQEDRDAREQLMAARERQQRLADTDPAANRTEADRLENLLTTAKNLSMGNNEARAVSYLAENGIELTEEQQLGGAWIPMLEDQIGQLRQDATLAERQQRREALTTEALMDGQFMTYARRGAAIENPELERDVVEGTMTSVSAEDVGNPVHFVRENLAGRLYNAISLADDPTEGLNNLGILYMTPDEVYIYDYYLGKGDRETAEEYLESLQEDLNWRWATSRYSRLEGSTAGKLAAGAQAGFEQFAQGVAGLGRAIRGDESYVPTSANTFLGSMAREGLADAGPQIMGSSLGQVAYDITQTTANMLPTILLSAATSGAAGAAGLGAGAAATLGEAAGALAIGASSGGGAYDQMINLGYNKGQARTYAALTGTAEATLQYAIGGVTQLGGQLSGNVIGQVVGNIDNAMARAAIRLGGEMASEFTEEYLQDVLAPVFENVAMGKHNNLNILDEEALYSGFLGAMTSIAFSGGQDALTAAGETVATYQQGLELQRQGVTAQRLAEIGLTFSADSVVHQMAERVNERTGAYTMARLYNEIGATLTEQNITDIRESLVEKGVASEDAAEISQVLALAVEEPGLLSAVQQQVLEKCSVAADAIRETLIDENSPMNRRMDAIRRLTERAVENVEISQEEADRAELPGDESLRERLEGEIRRAAESMGDMDFALWLNDKRSNLNDAGRKAVEIGDDAAANTYGQVIDRIDAATEAAMAGTEAANRIAALKNEMIDAMGGIFDEGTRYGSESETEGAGAGLPDGEIGRDAGPGAGVEAGPVGSERGNIPDAAAAETGRGVVGAFDVAVQQTPEQLGVPNGSGETTVGKIVKTSWTEAMQAAAQEAEALGYTMDYVTGPIEITNPTTGEVFRTNGVIYDGQILVRGDSRLYSAEQLAQHELLHARLESDRAMLQDMKERLVEGRSEAELRRIAERYAIMYESVYGDINEDMPPDKQKALLDKYIEEYVADAAAGINRVAAGDVNAARDTEVVQQVMREREGQGHGAGGMPGGEARFMASFAEDEQLFNPDGKSLDEQLDEILRGAESFESRYLYFGRFSDMFRTFLAENGIDVRNLPIVMNYRDAYLSMESRENGRYQGKNINYHNMGVEGMKSAIASLQSPDVVIRSKNTRRLEMALPFQDYKGRQGLAIVELNTAARNTGRYIEAHIVNSIYGKRNIDRYIEKARGEGRLLNRAEELSQGRSPVQYQGTVNENSSTKLSISDSAAESNTEFGLRSEREGLTTRWDRENAERETEAITESAPDLQNTDESVNRDFRASVADEDLGEVNEIDVREREAAEAEANTRKAIEAMTPTELRRAVSEDRAKVRQAEEYEKHGWLSDEALQDLRETRARLQLEESAKREMDARHREERAEVRKRVEARQQPTMARGDFIQKSLDLFSVKTGRNELSSILGKAFDDARSRGTFSETDRNALFNRLLESGMMSAEADPSFRYIRDALSGTRIYVPEDVRASFGDNWRRFANDAWGQRIYFTSDPNDNRIDGLNQELSYMFPGTFRETDTDLGAILENIVQTAKEGRAKNLTLQEMMQRVEDTEGWSVDDQLYDYERRFDALIDSAMHAAGIEVAAKTSSAMQLAKERQARREALERQAENRAMREQQDKTFKALTWLKKNRNRAPGDLRAQYDELIDGINLITKSAANEMQWSDRHNATYRDLRAMYLEAKENDPNWLPSKELEAIVSRLDDKAIADMDMSALTELYQAACMLRTEFYNRNNLINDEMHRTFSEVFRDSTEEIRNSAGQGSLGRGLAKLTNAEMMTPMNVLEMMSGWRKDGSWTSMARQLQAGERRRKGYVAEARAIIDAWTQDHQDWVRRADGQGKDAVWYELEVPELLELHMGDKPIFGNSVKVYMTPMQKIELYLESKNFQNLQHMTGGRTFVNRELYAKGERAEALAQGTTVRLAPESVKRIVSDLTAEELEFAQVLERYYNEKAKNDINAVSNPLYGFDKAMIDYYAPIFSDSNYNKTTAGIFDVTAEGVGHLKSREQVSKNPSYNISAIDAFQRHVDQTSRFVGLAIPIRNMTNLLNWFGDGTTMQKELSAKWGREGVSYITDLMTQLQSPQSQPESFLDNLLDKAVSNYITAVFGANPGIVFKQAASYPAAAAVLGFENLPSLRQLRGIDEEIINTYTPELAYRKLGYATPEVAQLRNNPNWMDRNRFTRFAFRGGAIQWMDTVTVKNLWAWAENYVRRTQPDLETGTAEQIRAGQSPYYRAVADAFNDAVNQTQPMYDVMNRAKIMNSKNALTRTLTLFKTVPMQEYNTLRQAIGEARAAGTPEAKRRAAQAVGSILASTLMLETVAAAAAWVTNGMKWYRDDDDELTAASFARAFGMNVAGDLAGIMIGGSELFDWITDKLGMNSYSSDFQIIGTEQINEFRDALETGGELLQNTLGGLVNVMVNGGDAGEYLERNGGDIVGGVHELASTLAKYLGGYPVDNIEKYLGGVLAKAAPELKALLSGITDTTTKSDLKRIDDKELPARLNSLLAIRNIEAEEGTGAELARLYLAGYTDAVPADTPASITTDGEERELTAWEMQRYDTAYTASIGESLNALVESEAYIEADDAGRAEMLGMLYDYANQSALREIDPEHAAPSSLSWVNKAAEAAESGIGVTTYIEARRNMKAADAANDGNGNITQAEAAEALRDMDLPDEQRAVLWQLTNSSWSEKNNPFTEPEESPVNEVSAPAPEEPAVTTREQEDETKEQEAAERELDIGQQEQEIASRGAGIRPRAAATQGREVPRLTSDNPAVQEALTRSNGRNESAAEPEVPRLTSDNEFVQNVLNSYYGDTPAAEEIKGQPLPETGDPTDRQYLRELFAEIEPLEGREKPTQTQKYRAIVDTFNTVEDQVAALRTEMSDGELMKIDIGRSRNVTPAMYVEAKERMYAIDDEGDNNDSTSSMEAKLAIDEIPYLTNDQRAVLWQLTNKSWRPYSNPYDTDVGQAVYDELHGAELQHEIPTGTTRQELEEQLRKSMGAW